MTLLERLERKLRDRRLNKMLSRFGGIQRCCWCRQCAQEGDRWNFRPWPRDLSLDMLTCGVCGGTSLWHFAMGMIFIGPLGPPSSAFPSSSYYDIEQASLKAAHHNADIGKPQ